MPTIHGLTYIGNPPGHVTLASADQRWEDIKAERVRRTLEAGVKVGQKWFNTDVISRSQYLRMYERAKEMRATGGELADVLQANGKNILWKTMDNTFVAVTVQVAFDIMSALDDRESAIFEAGEAHRFAMLASADPARYDFATGWPAAFGEAT